MCVCARVCVSLCVSAPLRDVELLWVGDDGLDVLDLLLAQLTSAAQRTTHDETRNHTRPHAENAPKNSENKQFNVRKE